MNAYLFLFIFEVSAFKSEDLNVGTVLFSPSDVEKKGWSTTEIGLLRARKRFQSLIPTSNMINTNEDFINAMLGYFRESYLAVKTESKDPETDSIMNAALSDAIGGYLKAWVLPITKFAYYGGTVTQEDALRLFQFYDEIKNCLNTDGSAWQSPNSNFLNSISINVAPLKLSPTIRGAKLYDPCDCLAYFEKTGKGLSIPVPNVHWGPNNEYSIFVPLKNQSVISLKSPNNETLFKYYNTAKNCIEKSKIDDHGDFERRFQNWLAKEVIPHLNDEQLYPALGSVLTLVNTTRNLADTVLDIYNDKHNEETNKYIIAGIPINFSSKKMIVMTVIILLEIAWCIPTLCYLMCVRIKKKKKPSSDAADGFYLLVNKKDQTMTCLSVSTQIAPSICSGGRKCIEETYVWQKDETRKSIKPKEAQIDRVKSCNLDARFSNISKHSLGTCTRSNYSSQTLPLNVAKIVHERPMHSRHLKPKNYIAESLSQEMCINKPDKECFSQTDSVSTIQELDPTKTVTLLKQRNVNNKETNMIDDGEKHKAKKTFILQSNVSKEYYTSTDKSESFVHEKHTFEASKGADLKRTEGQKTTQVRDKTVSACKSGGLKLSFGEPYLEITIEKQRHIEYTGKGRQSRIPKITSHSTGAQTINRTAIKTQFIAFESLPRRKSYIPQPKRHDTVDDIVVESNKKYPENTQDSVLNKTL